MFWKTKKLETNQLSEKINCETSTLIDILEESDILQECSVKNQELFNLFVLRTLTY